MLRMHPTPRPPPAPSPHSTPASHPIQAALFLFTLLVPLRSHPTSSVNPSLLQSQHPRVHVPPPPLFGCLDVRAALLNDFLTN